MPYRPGIAGLPVAVIRPPGFEAFGLLTVAPVGHGFAQEMDTRTVELAGETPEGFRAAQYRVDHIEIEGVIMVPRAIGGIGRPLVGVDGVEPDGADSQIGQIVNLPAEGIQPARIAEPRIYVACRRGFVENPVGEPSRIRERL